MIKNIIFDLGNVIVQNPTLDTAKEFFTDENDANTFYNYIHKSSLWEMMDLGQISNLELANKIIDQKLVNVKNSNEIKNFMLNWFSKCNINADTMELGKKLKNSGYKIYVLSNMAKETYEYFSSTYDFFKILDGAVVSAYEGVIKPDAKIFEIILNRYSLVPEECLLIDDINVANSIGIHGRRVKPNDCNDVKKLLQENNIQLD